jgi:predicted metal-binding membrane protein
MFLLLSLAIVTIGAWALTVHQARTMDMPMGVVLRAASNSQSEPAGSDPMDGMAMDAPSTSGMQSVASSGMSGMGPESWSWASFSAFLVAWTVMMAAMMFPAVAPLLLLYRSMASGRSGGHAPVWILAAGYLLVWTAAGAVAWTIVQVGIEIGNRLGAGTRGTVAPLALGATLIVAGLYQLTPLKQACLRQCQSPIGFLMSHWQAGKSGAVRMGLQHGLFCLGCCWALFAVLVAAGVMSLGWMLLLTLVVFAEKVIRPGAWSQKLTGSALVALGLLVAAGAAAMPWPA